MKVRRILGQVERFTVMGLLLAGFVSAGCLKVSSKEARRPAPRPSADVVQPKASPPAATKGGADPATFLSYKTGVPRDQVEKILAIYEKSAKKESDGSEIYKIALFASQQMGIPTEQVGSVILGYRSLSFDAGAPGSEQTGKDVVKN